MKRFTAALGVGLLATGLTIAHAQSGAQAEKLFEAARHKKVIEGDLRGAIEQYKKLSESRDRAVASRALLEMAECYETLGDFESRKIYERLRREFADQQEAVTVARAKLANPAPTGTKRLWTASPSLDYINTAAAISSDGRFLTYADWGTGNLAVHDFATGRDRYLTNHGYPNWAEYSAISRDTRQVVYSQLKGNTYELRLVSLEGPGVPTSRLLYVNEDLRWVFPYDWSPNGQIVVQLSRQDHTRQLGLISVRDRSLQVLKTSSEWTNSTEVFFSPDGRYLGFDLPDGGPAEPRDVWILRVDGVDETRVVTGASNDTMMGWSPDGKYLLFASDRGGTTGLWAVPIAEGKPKGSPEPMNHEISPFSLGVSSLGNLYYGVNTGDRDIRTADVDFKTGKLLKNPVRPIQSFVGSNVEPIWSPDGNSLAYVSQRTRLGRNSVLGVLSLVDGQTREFEPELSYFQNPRWTSDGRLMISGTHAKGRSGPWVVDWQTKGIVATDPTLPSSADGKTVFVRKDLGAQGISYSERDANGAEKELIRRKGLGPLSLSPEKRFIATAFPDWDDNSSVVLLIPVSGGEPRELLRVKQAIREIPPPSFSWLPDGSAVLFNKFTNNGKGNELWLLPVDGKPPRKIDIGTSQFEGSVRVNPDGHRIAYVSGERRQEVWTVQNFLPTFLKP